MSITRTCSIEGCENKHYAKGYCVTHYNKWHRHGNPMFDISKKDIRYCTVAGCENKYYSRYMCIKHYKRVYNIEVSIYLAWRSMKDRCYNKNNKNYKDYGERGIKVFDEWINDFSKFYNYIGEKPDIKYTLDRIDNDKGYFPGNVRWATRLEQARNRRIFKNNTSGCSGVTWNNKSKKWQVNANYNKKSKYIGIYSDINDAINICNKIKESRDNG